MRDSIVAVSSVSLALLCGSPAAAQVTISQGGADGTRMVSVSAAARDSTPDPTGTARIRGRVVAADTGAGIRNVQIRLMGGGLREGRTTGTDAEGRYEIESLPAGRFTLSAAKAGFVTLSYGQRRPFEAGRPVEIADKQVLEQVDFALPKGGVIVARVTDEQGEPMSGVRVQAERFRFIQGQQRLSPVTSGGSSFGSVTDDRGEMRLYGLPPGEYFVSAGGQLPGPMSAVGPAERARSYVTSYHPGTASLAQAQKVQVQVGREVGVTFPLVAARLARVTAVVRGSDGNALKQPSVSLSYSTGSGGGSRSMNSQPDGAFSLPDIPPGEFTIEVSPNFNDRSGNGEYTSVPVVVGGDDLRVAITTGKGSRLRGRFVFDTPAPAELRPTSVRPSFTRVPVVFSGSGATPVVNDDWTFELAAVMGSGLVRMTTQAAGWYLKAVLQNGKDVTDTLLDASDGKEMNGLEIVLTRVRSEVNGVVADTQNTPVAEYVTVLFPESREDWTSQSRFFGTGRADQKGAYKITGLPPGRYLAVAVDYLETGSERDPELLNRLRDSATLITLEDGKPQTLNLRLVTY